MQQRAMFTLVVLLMTCSAACGDDAGGGALAGAGGAGGAGAGAQAGQGGQSGQTGGAAGQAGTGVVPVVDAGNTNDDDAGARDDAAVGGDAGTNVAECLTFIDDCIAKCDQDAKCGAIVDACQSSLFGEMACCTMQSTTLSTGTTGCVVLGVDGALGSDKTCAEVKTLCAMCDAPIDAVCTSTADTYASQGTSGDGLCSAYYNALKGTSGCP